MLNSTVACTFRAFGVPMEDEEETDDDVPQEASNTVTPGKSPQVKSIKYLEF